jgi:hypothetical protein
VGVLTCLPADRIGPSQPLKGRQDLKDGDVLVVSGLTLEFHLK